MVELVKFTVQTASLRVIGSPIGRVVPVVDIAKAIDYPRNKINEIIERYNELFDGTWGTVTVSEVCNNKGTMAEQRRHIKALNVYGVVGLLFKLNYNRIADPDKRERVLRFQRWAMRELGKKFSKRKRSPEAVKIECGLAGDVELIGYKDAAQMLGKTVRAVQKMAQRGKLVVYGDGSGGRTVYLDKAQVEKYM